MPHFTGVIDMTVALNSVIKSLRQMCLYLLLVNKQLARY